MRQIENDEQRPNKGSDNAGERPDHENRLPRSVTRSNQYELLDGDWPFELDPNNAGLGQQWYLGHAWSSRAHWPHAIEACLAACKQPPWRTHENQQEVVAWYEREFEIPKHWLETSNELVQLTFGACGYETSVWLNGHRLRTNEGEEAHVGEYTSFSYEFPQAFLQPVNRLTVRIADSLDAEIPRGKQESRVYKRGGIWYQTISGPVRSIWIELVERNRLRSRIEVISIIEQHCVQLKLTTRVQDPGTYTLRLIVTEEDKLPEPLVVVEHQLRLDPGENAQWVRLRVPEAHFWSPTAPSRYHLTAQLISSVGDVSQIETRFGLRKIEARGHNVYLNNQPLYLDGILYQPATATYEQVCRHMLAIKALGCNLVRVHISGIDPRIYDLADELGMLVWVEVPSPHASSQRSRENHWAELKRMLALVLTHPSVTIVSLYNEDWGVQDIATNPDARSYIAKTFHYMRVHHPQVLVVDNDGWHHVSTEGRLASDLLTAHLYTADLEQWQSLLDRLVHGETAGVASEPLVVGDPFFYSGQVPLLVSEWGGFGWSGYGGPEEAQAKAERIRVFKRELRRRDIAGDVYTEAVNVEDETNGLIDADTGALEVPAAILQTTYSGSQNC